MKHLILERFCFILVLLVISCSDSEDVNVDNSKAINLTDKVLESVCLANWDSNNDGKFSENEAAAVTDLGDVFRGSDIENFDEFRRFKGLESIGNNAFESCTKLKYIILPDNITKIGESAFENCVSIRTISIPRNVTSICSRSFAGCQSLRMVKCASDTPPVGGSGMFDGNDESRKIQVPMHSLDTYRTMEHWNDYSADIIGDISQNIPFASKEIEALCVFLWDTDNDGKLSYQEALAVTTTDSDKEHRPQITEPCTFDELKYFRNLKFFNYGFISNSCIKSISLPQSVTSIGEVAFGGCNSLITITIPEGVTSIGEAAFQDCTNLESIIFDNCNPKMKYSQFEGCHNLKIIDFGDKFSNFTWDNNGSILTVFNDIPNLSEVKGKYATADGRCIIMDNVLKIFAPFGLTEYTIPDGVVRIDTGSFSPSPSTLERLSLPESVTEIGYRAFWRCTHLKYINLENVKRLEWLAFAYCTSLERVDLSCLEEIEAAVFLDCINLRSMYIDEIPKCLTNASLPASLGGNIDLTQLEGKYATDNGRLLVKDGKVIMSATHGLNEYVIPNGITDIMDNAFIECKLKSVTIPDSVKTIGRKIFLDCTDIESLYCKPTTPPRLLHPLSEPFGSITIYVPHESVEAYKTAQHWCDFADNIVGYDF
ncbi:MAG: leucine-rich repeat domain-containing protein [Alistipes sp.]|nr:leucine-rich repeat domain-containing protein [Alistipes sp.]